MPSRDWTLVIVVAGAAGVSQTFGRFTYSLLLTDVRDDFGLSNTVAGGLGTVNLAAYLVGSLAVSLLIARIGAATVTRVGIVASTIGIAALAWSPRLLVVVVGQVITGLGGAAVWITAPSLATAAIAPNRRGLAIGLAGTGIGGAMVLASAVETSVATDRWRIVYAVQVVIAIVVTIAVLATTGRGRPARPAEEVGAPEPIGFSSLQSLPGWKPLLTAYGLFGLSLALFINFLVATLEDDAGYSPGAAAAAFSAFGIGTIFGGPCFGPLSDRWGRRPALVIALCLMVASSLTVATGARPWATVAALVFGVSFIGVPTGVAARVRDHVDGAAFGGVFGLATLSFGAALMVGPQLGGAIGDLAGSFVPVFLLAAVVAAIAAVAAWWATP